MVAGPPVRSLTRLHAHRGRRDTAGQRAAFADVRRVESRVRRFADAVGTVSYHAARLPTLYVPGDAALTKNLGNEVGHRADALAIAQGGVQHHPHILVERLDVFLDANEIARGVAR